MNTAIAKKRINQVLRIYLIDSTNSDFAAHGAFSQNSSWYKIGKSV